MHNTSNVIVDFKVCRGSVQGRQAEHSKGEECNVGKNHFIVGKGIVFER